MESASGKVSLDFTDLLAPLTPHAMPWIDSEMVLLRILSSELPI